MGPPFWGVVESMGSRLPSAAKHLIIGTVHCHFLSSYVFVRWPLMNHT